MAGTVAVTNESFESLVEQAERPVLVDFWASWCPPCKMIAPVLEQLAQSHGERLTVAKLDVDEHPELAMRFGVQSIPTLLLFKQGQPVWRQVGASSGPDLVRSLEPHLEPVQV